MSGAGETTRLDQVVSQRLSISRSQATKIIAEELVKVNGKVVTKSASKVNSAADIQIDFDPSAPANFDPVKLDILYEDDDCLVIVKPAGLLTHSKGAFNPEPTVATWLNSYYQGPITERSGIVHRLDRATSGVMIVAKNETAVAWLQKQFSTRKVKKTYMAIIKGQLKTPQALIDLPIERNPKKPQTFRVGPQGKPAQTEYLVRSTSPHYSLVELKPTTGRTHQLRVHLAYLGHAIVGDNLYNGEQADRLYLHARSLELILPSGRMLGFESQPPPSFKRLLKNDQ